VQYQLPNVCMKAVLAAASDGQQSVRWLRKYATALRLDPARISMGGSSAGAGVAIVVAASPSAGSPTVPSSTIRTAFSISGASPTNIIFGAGDSPIYFWHGTADTISPIAWARANVGAMQTKGLTAEIHEVAGAGHVPFTQYADDMDTQARNWVYDQMDLARADQRGVPGS